jgi:exosome complex RNA-binding protein Rrp4
MKTVFKVLMVCLLVGVFSCRDTKKEEAETNAAVEQIEAIEAEADHISKEIDREAEELENELKELDKI